jgi:hypothetical protein
LRNERLFVVLFFVFVVSFIVLVFFFVFFVIAGTDAAGAEAGVETVVAIFFIVADIFGWSEFGAVRGLLGRLDSSGRVEKPFAVNEERGDSETGEETRGFFQIEATADDGVVDAGDGEVDGGRIFGCRELQRSKPQVRLGADGVSFGVVVAERSALERRGLAAKSVGLDVATGHEHVGRSPLKCFFAKVLDMEEVRFVWTAVTS